MTVRKADRDFAEASLGAIESMLKETPASEFVARWSLENQRKYLLKELEGMQTIEGTRASAELYFGGSPVDGNRGIRAKFGARMADAFQELVTKTAAVKYGGELRQ